MDEAVQSLAHEIVRLLEQKGGEDILLLDLVGVCSFTDAFVICSAGSERTLKALADELRRKLKGAAQLPRPGIEGSPSSGWLLLDYGPVVVHIFSPAVRNYYRLEDLWHEGRVVVHLV